MKNYLRGFGVGVLFVTILLVVIRKPETLTDAEVQSRAARLGMLTEQEAELLSRREQLQGEYDAIALAMEVLSQADTNLQNRFSPALGERAASIFTNLTGGRYNRVLLDRSMTPSAQQADQLTPREGSQLSQGTADQLYLAVRLAVCDLVLPPENAVPIVLDDALSSFDDQRCAAALDYLRKEAEKRQILLFTCHSREAAHFQDDPGVSIRHLTAPAEGV